MTPDACTSLHCQGPCENCQTSHAVFFGRGIDRNGKLWRWEFNYYFGPLFLRKDGEPMVNQPGGKHPAWSAFDRWWVRFDHRKHRAMWE